ncbi:histidine phosphotransferase [Oleomonas cavernae]|uniref:Histidine phosphotransferase n=1 Tax=Oleomonas cavernae TaxID=2320859 RepID=A0A418WTM8_9PROT|nr:histidine phosphotransferase family protein [Oleomonas cavernae]RJF94621.1 histidine phosphotransferase [Oleomonas cavernae]
MNDPLRLVGLLCSRLCHDLVGPVGAVVNGVELLTDAADDDDLRDQSIALIGDSANELSARLRFFRIAFGAAGGDVPMARDELVSIVAPVLQGRRISLGVEGARDGVPREQLRLLFTLALIAADCLPRGGRLTLDLETTTFVAQGDRCALPAGLAAALAGAEAELDPRSAPGALARQLAGAEGLVVTAAAADGAVTIGLSAQAS